MTYNLTGIDNATNIYDITATMNDLTGSMFAMFILAIIFFVLFAYMKNYDTKTVFLVASFITSFIGVMMYFIEFISMSTLLFPIIMLVVSIIVKVFGDSGSY